MHGYLDEDVPFLQTTHHLNSCCLQQACRVPLPPAMTALSGQRAGTCRAFRLLHQREPMQVLRKQSGIQKLPASHQRHAEPHTCLSALLTYTPKYKPCTPGTSAACAGSMTCPPPRMQQKVPRLCMSVRDSHSPHTKTGFLKGSFWPVLVSSCASHACTPVVEPLLLLAG